MTARFEPVPGDWHHAPDHLVALVAALSVPPEPDPTGESTTGQWYGRIRRIVDQIWSTAWLAGVTDYAARVPTRIEIAAGAPLPPAVVATAAPTAPGGPSVPPRARTRS